MAKTGAEKPRSYTGDYMTEGQRAEELVIAWLKRQSFVKKVDDLRQSRPMQEADADVSIHIDDGRVRLAEIKSDKYLGVTDNVLFEIMRINHTSHSRNCATLGWSVRTPAEVLLYYAPGVDKLYICEFEDLRKAFQKYTHAARKETNINIVETDSIKTTINILIPMSYCKGIFKIRSVGSAELEDIPSGAR